MGSNLGPWLHQAAYRAACHERSSRMRHRAHERAAAALRPERVEPGDQNDGLERLIHEEIERLPDRYRCVVVLCDLESRTHEQAARHLGCALGTVKSRLSRGRCGVSRRGSCKEFRKRAPRSGAASS
jgi:DNA-directed RNA polymerase specialized sigma24 family protein